MQRDALVPERVGSACMTTAEVGTREHRKNTAEDAAYDAPERLRMRTPGVAIRSTTGELHPCRAV